MTALVILLCLIVSFTFAGIEAGLLSLNPARLRHRVKTGDRAALRLERILERPAHPLLATLLITGFVNVLALSLVTLHLARLLGPAGYVAAALLALPVWVLGLGLLPKSIFRRAPCRTLARLALPLSFATSMLSPVLLLLESIARLFPAQRRTRRSSIFVARQEVKFLTAESERSGILTPAEREIIDGIIDFREVTVRDLMTPWERVATLPENAGAAEFRQTLARTGADLMPVLSIDGRLVGLVDTFETLLDPGQPTGVRSHIRRIDSCPPQEPAYRLLRRLRAARLPLAAVLSPDSIPLGVVRLEDLVRRLVQPPPPPGGAARG